MPAKAAAPEKKRKAAPEKEEQRGNPADDGAAAASKVARVIKEFNAQVDAVAAQEFNAQDAAADEVKVRRGILPLSAASRGFGVARFRLARFRRRRAPDPASCDPAT